MKASKGNVAQRGEGVKIRNTRKQHTRSHKLTYKDERFIRLLNQCLSACCGAPLDKSWVIPDGLTNDGYTKIPFL